ncbi:MAG TPA: hypothetical protein VL307_09130 [Chitinophagaceae bacterium]|nr:hypothetical protein [Chitinophagaceae bacterium]
MQKRLPVVCRVYWLLYRGFGYKPILMPAANSKRDKPMFFEECVSASDFSVNINKADGKAFVNAAQGHNKKAAISGSLV